MQTAIATRPPFAASFPTQPSKPKSLRVWLFLLGFYGLSVVGGIRDIYYWKQSFLDLIIPFLMAIVLGWWALADAKSRGHRIPKMSLPWFFLFAVFAVPAYVIWSRNWRGVGLVLLHLIGFCVLYVLVSSVGGELVFGDEWSRKR
jgi:UDP-N-acetylmuramyl pentapeptide phosphotransferase/UDP-N-acetylglucosamine-1-phosphate transferase